MVDGKLSLARLDMKIGKGYLRYTRTNPLRVPGKTSTIHQVKGRNKIYPIHSDL